MTIKEILEIENANTGSINLCKEGLFWRAYNQSAMRLVNNLKPLKIIRKYIKKAGQEIFYCGFPESGLDNIRGKAIEKGFQITETNDKKIIISGVSATEDYKNWMGNQPACLSQSSYLYALVLKFRTRSMLPALFSPLKDCQALLPSQSRINFFLQFQHSFYI